MASTAPVDRPIRFWPVWIILTIQLVALVLTITPSFSTGYRFGFMMLGPALCFLLFGIWLLFASRLTWKERLLIASGGLVFGALTMVFVAEMVRVAVWIYGVPLAMGAIALTLYWRRGRARNLRLSSALVGAFLAFGWLFLVRLDGFTGEYHPEFDWRWAASSEPSLAVETPAALLASVVPEVGSVAEETADPSWPGFRGPDRSGAARGVVTSDWQEKPPSELWRIPIGPAWSSFAHTSGMLFTQEQRGEEELVSCYDADTGSLIWQHSHPNRFNEVVSGAGPRATPSLADDRLFAFGARAILTALDVKTGRQLWQRDLMAEMGAPLPVWGFSSSPLVVGEAVIVYAGGTEDSGLVAFDREDGTILWQIASRGMNFSSAQLVTLGGREQVLFADTSGVFGTDPESGDVLWRFKPSEWAGPPIVQSQQIGDGSLIVPLGDGAGLVRLEVEGTGDEWQVVEGWTSRMLKPSFNDFVYHEGFLYGFDRSIFTCIDAETGERRWKRGRFGFGQVILVPESDRMILQAEKGDVVLLAADPTDLRELGRLEPLSGKTWNHPMIAGNRLVVRNGSEAVALALE